jgi:inorganic triphosphatase YgiF
MTLKGLETVKGVIHRREELQIVLLKDEQPVNWPLSPARDRMLQIMGGELLGPLFDLRQTRLVRPITRDDHQVAELGLDNIVLVIGEQRHAYCELEVGLMSSGTEDDLAVIVACLQDEWGLVPELRSKFERALELIYA